ncbi:MAG: hypothetical protein JXQ96_00970 [Cyclobacteriaceae bacterium]
MTNRTITKASLVAFLFGISTTVFAQSAHVDHDHTHHSHETASVAHHHSHGASDAHHEHENAKSVSGQGDFVFSWDEALTGAFPKDAQEFEPKMHGGFNEDPETGIVYTGIPGYGLCSISSDLTKWSTIGSDERLKDNIHGIVFFVHKGQKLLAVAQEGKRVLVLTLDGKIISEIVKPTGTEFDFTIANEFFASEDSNFGVTDVTYLKGTLYVAHGYSKGDFVLTITEKDGDWSWGKLAWGGKGDQPGQFQTAHGVYAHSNHILVANRAAGQVVKFTKKGKFVETFNDIPEGSLVCNVSFETEHFFFNALKPIGEQKSAPIYAHNSEKLISTIVPGDLGIPILTNIHHVWPHFVEKNGSKQLYLLVHGWNKGKFAVLKLEK